MSSEISAPVSLTHEHLLSIVRTRLAADMAGEEPVRILDVGCGSGVLIAYLQMALAVLEAGRDVTIYGLDVVDHGVQAEGFFAETVVKLETRFPHIDWTRRLYAISSDDSWPFPDGFFDIILSNQVLEHVCKPEAFFSEVARTLREGGWSAHLFPVKACIIDGHLGLPWVHRLRNFDLLRRYIHLCNRFGIGRYRRNASETLDVYAERHADYMLHYTNYLSYQDLFYLSKGVGLRCTFRYTIEYYRLKLRSVIGCPDKRHQYLEARPVFLEWISFHCLKYVASITLFLEKKQIYRNRKCETPFGAIDQSPD